MNPQRATNEPILIKIIDHDLAEIPFISSTRYKTIKLHAILSRLIDTYRNYINHITQRGAKKIIITELIVSHSVMYRETDSTRRQVPFNDDPLIRGISRSMNLSIFSNAIKCIRPV